MFDRFYRSRFHYWLGSPRGAAVYFGTCYTLLILGVLLLTGCNVTLDRAPVVTVTPPEFYTRYEIDAINAENACRQMARTLLQAQRCTVRR